MNPFAIAAVSVGFFATGVVVGGVLAIVVLRLTGRMVGLASPGPLAVAQPETRVVSSPEAMAHHHISQSAIDVGAAHLMEVAKENGIRLTDKMARAQAEAMLREGQPLGGVQ